MTEIIGGGSADLWLSELQRDYRTGAVWDRPTAIYFLGKSVRKDHAQLQLDVYRTVRFDLPDPGK